MFHMLSCFNLKPGVTIESFSRSLVQLDDYLRKIDLVESTGRIGRRQHHPVMDTDSERDHQYFVIMTFRDRDQCDRSVGRVKARDEPLNSIHHAVWHQVEDPVFICWEDA